MRSVLVGLSLAFPFLQLPVDAAASVFESASYLRQEHFLQVVPLLPSPVQLIPTEWTHVQVSHHRHSSPCSPEKASNPAHEPHESESQDHDHPPC